MQTGDGSRGLSIIRSGTEFSPVLCSFREQRQHSKVFTPPEQEEHLDHLLLWVSLRCTVECYGEVSYLIVKNLVEIPEATRYQQSCSNIAGPK